MAIKQNPDKGYDQELRHQIDKYADETAPHEEPQWKIVYIHHTRKHEIIMEMEDLNLNYPNQVIYLNEIDLIDAFGPSADDLVE